MSVECASDFRAPELVGLTDSTGYASSTHAVEQYAELGLHARSPSSARGAFNTDAQRHTQGQRSTYLEIRTQLPIREIRHALIEVYFGKCNWFFGLVGRSHFDEWLAEWEVLNQDLGSSTGLVMRCWRFTGLLFQLLAVALQFLEPYDACLDSFDVDSDASRTALSHRFSENGVQLSDLAGRYDADIVGVHQGLLRAFWLKNSGRGKEAWFTLGECIR